MNELGRDCEWLEIRLAADDRRKLLLSEMMKYNVMK